MKKLIPLLMTALLVCLFPACDDETTKLRWENQSGLTASQIQWMPVSGNYNYQYTETLDENGQTTAFKEIDSKDLSGFGECSLDDGTPAEIDWGGDGNSIILSDGESQTYEIRSAKK